MTRSAFITGIAGFAGSHLAEALLKDGWRVAGILMPGEALTNLEHLSGRLVLGPCDIRTYTCLEEAVHRARPDVIYHLAGTTSIPEGEQDPRGILDANLFGTLNLLEALRAGAPVALLVFISSSEVYGRVLEHENPVREGQPEAPTHHYGLSKLLCERLVFFYHRRYGTRTVVLRPFNHIGPRQSDRFVCSSFARQLVEIEQGRQEPVIRVGNLDAVRDFTDVRDMVNAYRLAADRCEPGSLYHIASGKGVRIGSVLREILSLSHVPIDVRQEPARVRESEIPVLIGDAAAFIGATGWQGKIELSATLKDTVDYWRKTASAPNGG